MQQLLYGVSTGWSFISLPKWRKIGERVDKSSTGHPEISTQMAENW